MPFEKGNQLGKNSYRWRDAINRALAKRSRKAMHDELELLANKLIDMALAGDLGAIKEIGNRLDGLPVQSVAVQDRTDLTVILQYGLADASDDNGRQLSNQL